MDTRSNEVIKQLNRLANDRSIPPQVRARVRDAAQHVRNLQIQLDEISEHLNLDEEDITCLDIGG